MPIRKPLTQYPIPLASKKFELVDLKGPVLYVPGTGDVLTANMFEKGLGFEAVMPANYGVSACTQGGVARNELHALSFSGTYFVTITFPTDTIPGECAQSIAVKWYVAATGAEAGAIDLSAETFRALMIFG